MLYRIAKNIKSTVRRNVLNVDYHISEYVQLINNLRNEIKELKDQLHTSPISRSIPTTASHQSRYLQPIDRAGTPRNMIPISSPIHTIRESLKSNNGIAAVPLVASSGAGSGTAAVDGAGRDLLNKMRAIIVENFQERMQLR
jgi:hypothetical protein